MGKEEVYSLSYACIRLHCEPGVVSTECAHFYSFDLLRNSESKVIPYEPGLTSLSRYQSINQQIYGKYREGLFRNAPPKVFSCIFEGDFVSIDDDHNHYFCTFCQDEYPCNLACVTDCGHMYCPPCL